MFHSPSEFYEPNSTNEIRTARKRTGQPGEGAVAMLMQALSRFDHELTPRIITQSL